MAPELTTQQEAFLKKLFFEEKMMFGRDRLFWYINDNHPDQKISRRQIADFLKKQEVAQLYHPVKRTKNIQSTILSEPFKVVGVDLIDMQSSAFNGYEYIFTAIDLFSRYAWCIPMQTKTADDSVKALRKLLKEIKNTGKLPSVLRSDNGSEFISPKFKKELENNKIKQVLSTAGTPQSNGAIERFNGTIKRLIKMESTQEDNQDWVSQLPKLVENYNKTRNRSIGKAPLKVVSEWKDGNKKDMEAVKAKMEKSVSRKNEKAITSLIPVGSRVRLKLKGDKHQKRDKLWTDEVYKVVKAVQPRSKNMKAYYLVENSEGEQMSDKLYGTDLLVIKRVQTKIKFTPQKFIVSSIKDRKETRSGVFYLVKWRNDSKMTWEPRSNLLKDVPKKIKAYDTKHPLSTPVKKTPAAPKKTPAAPKKEVAKVIDVPQTGTILSPIRVGGKAKKSRKVNAFVVKWGNNDPNVIDAAFMKKNHPDMVNSYTNLHGPIKWSETTIMGRNDSIPV